MHIQYRLMLLGRLGGVMRAAKKFIGHGALKLYTWHGIVDYAQADVPTKWGVFGFSFWLQFRDVPQLRIARFVQRYRKILRSMLSRRNESAVPMPDSTELTGNSFKPFIHAFLDKRRARTAVIQSNRTVKHPFNFEIRAQALQIRNRVAHVRSG